MDELRNQSTPFRLSLVLCAGCTLLFQLFLNAETDVRAYASLPGYVVGFTVIFLVGQLFRFADRLSNWIFHALYFIYFSGTFLFNAFYEDAAHRRYSILDADAANISYLLNSVIPLKVFLYLILALIITYSVAFLLRRFFQRVVLITSVVGLLAFVGGVNAQGPDLNDYVSHDVSDYIDNPPLSSGFVPEPYDSLNFQDVDALKGRISGKYKRVLLFVMESITVQEMSEECSTPECTFEKYRAISHEYKNYYGANQDSRTGILSLLFSRFIPYFAYAERDVQSYEWMKEKKSLLDLFKDANYTTSMAASVTDHERVLMDLPWDHLITLETDEIQAQKKYQCLNPYKFEHSCEDRILLDRLVDFVAQQKKVFLLQEFLYGHAPEYNRLKGINTCQYYADYIKDFIAALRKRGLMKDTLIIITSDHGHREPQAIRFMESYHLPLIFIHGSGPPKTNSGFFAPMDFVRIFLAEESGGEMVQSRRNLVPLMGSTGSGLTGALTDEKKLVLIKKRRLGPRLFLDQGISGTTPAKISGMHENYRADFSDL